MSPRAGDPAPTAIGIQRGLLRAAWGVTDNNRKARFYAMTAAGRRRLAAEKAQWDRMTSIIHTLLRDEG